MNKAELVIKNTLKMTKKTDDHLSTYATKNSACLKIKQPLKDKQEFDIRWPFEEDIDRILYSSSYQRYVDKTQALSFFSDVHISKRSIHVQWVSRIARQIGRGLGLNQDLIEAAALGHDLGHAPYGHVGEIALNDILQERGFGYFNHNANSVRNILFIERKGRGYNVSLQVLDAILCHNGEMLSKKYEPDYQKTISQFCQEYEDCWHKKDTSLHIRPMSLEGCVVRVSDVIAYIGKDIEDAIKVGIIKQSDLPKEVTVILGHDNKSIINRLIGDIVIHSYDLPYLCFSNEVFQALKTLLAFLGDKVHHHPTLVKENAKLKRMIKQLYDYYYDELMNPNINDSKIKAYLRKMDSAYHKNDPILIVCDYLSMMTDSYILKEYENIFLPIQHHDLL